MMPGDAIDSLGLLVVDDEPANLRLLERVLWRAGFVNIRSTTSPREALQMAGDLMPDIVLIDLHMPEMSGVAVMRELNAVDADMQPLVVMLTGDDSRAAKAEALSAGAKDFITKPFDTTEVALRIRNFADLRIMHKRLQQSNDSLEQKVQLRTAELERARLDILDRLAMAAEFRDDATGQHTRRVGAMAGRLAVSLSLSARNVQLIERAAPLHDVGKIAIPDSILLKPHALEPEEMNIMRTHTTVGAKLLSATASPLLEAASEIALSHHERWDGKGYPRRLGGAEIPLTGRIVALADFFDALTHDRPYRTANRVQDVVGLIHAERGRHFDPDVVDAFLEIAL